MIQGRFFTFSCSFIQCSGGLTKYSIVDFIKSGRLHEIHKISQDFMKSNRILLDYNADFNVDYIMDFSVDLMDFIWNPPNSISGVFTDFMWISCESIIFHYGFHEIQNNLQQDFMNLRDFKGFYEINRTLLDYSTDFNVDFIMISLWISFVDLMDLIWNPPNSIWKIRRK